MDKHTLNDGDIIAGRYRIVTLLGSGFAAEVYRVLDEQSNNEYALKIYKYEFIFSEYIEYLKSLSSSLSGLRSRYVLMPLDSGIYKNMFWQITELIYGAKALNDILFQERHLNPSLALEFLSKVASAVAFLHNRQIIHADIKPHNILIDSRTNDPILVDFGMALKLQNDQFLFCSTYQYMPPELRASEKSGGSGIERVSLIGPIGPYMDVYALGVMSLQMLTGEVSEPKPLSEHRLIAFLLDRNPIIRHAGGALVEVLAKLLFRMLTVTSGGTGITAEEISGIAASLSRAFLEETKVEVQQPTRESEPYTIHADHARKPDMSVLDEAIDRLNVLTEKMIESTAIMLRTAERLETASPVSEEGDLLREMNLAFENASARTRASWRIGTSMTIIAFTIVVGMIAIAVVLGIRTGASAWTIIFGGSSASAAVGALLWRPYDRIFRATILAQQIEMIHVKSVAAFKGTTDINRRLDVCQEAINSLETLLERHTGKEKVNATRTRRKKRN